MSARHAIADARAFGRVAVLMGGISSERDISLLTGNAVLAGLRRRGVDAHGVDAADDLPRALARVRYDRAWNALHGPGGEDGAVQGLLEYLGIPYTGTGILGSALAMDKERSKTLFAAAGLATPPFVVVEGPGDFARVLRELGLPLAVKPAGQGSSVGVTKVVAESGLPAAFAEAARFGDAVLAERWITGAEYAAPVLQGEVLPMIRIEPAAEFYDYDAKYFSDATRYHCPCGLPEAVERACATQALLAFDVVGARGWGRVDLLLDAAGTAYVLEVNTVPGMTDHSLVPMGARARGMDFDELAWRVLETSFDAAPAERTRKVT
jgi:D-alanine-D-alanine ligase